MKRIPIVFVAITLFAGTATAQDVWLDLTNWGTTEDPRPYSVLRVKADPEDEPGILQWASNVSGGDSALTHVMFENGKVIHARHRLAKAIEALAEAAGPQSDAILAEYGIVLEFPRASH